MSPLYSTLSDSLIANAHRFRPPTSSGTTAELNLSHYDTKTSPFLDRSNPFTAWCAERNSQGIALIDALHLTQCRPLQSAP